MTEYANILCLEALGEVEFRVSLYRLFSMWCKLFVFLFHAVGVGPSCAGSESTAVGEKACAAHVVKCGNCQQGVVVQYTAAVDLRHRL